MEGLGYIRNMLKSVFSSHNDFPFILQFTTKKLLRLSCHVKCRVILKTVINNLLNPYQVWKGKQNKEMSSFVFEDGKNYDTKRRWNTYQAGVAKKYFLGFLVTAEVIIIAK